MSRKHQNDSRIPVTVLSGFLGAGKTTTLNKLLSNKAGAKLAVIVNDMSEVNVDAMLVKQSKDEMIELSNGCICCTLHGDLLDSIAAVVKERSVDGLDGIVIESTGISEPLPVAQTLSLDPAELGDDSLTSVADLVYVDTMVTVVDGPALLARLAAGEDLISLSMAENDDDDRTVADLLIDQIEFADVILVNKADVATKDEIDTVVALVRRLNRNARVITTIHGLVEPKAIFGTRRFNLDVAETAPGWLQELLGVHTPETEEYGISSFVYRSKTPFSTQRMFDLADADDTPFGQTVIRAKGFLCSLLTRWLSALRHGLTWLIRLRSGTWPEDPIMRKEIKKNWDPRWGDRATELVCIGVNMDKAVITEALNACLLTPDEMALGPEAWADMADPLEEWDDATEAHGDNHQH
ncbi:cobalamin synthesis protein [Thecamonas trahens ATCC 50062]|uniref:Cobalamin synthesis protein n=1 Tax=Thecamonas trahens ATCC 50062 TaxID=461836 RepID=A0A0L0DUF7_THETB|nr:cobalamin synthesis protein [Thecamonas trahens ATCC 50062]KNC55078.1 cobalamin synthesis protein [Thecamonas trahens ATCC 50062]|eukprot:XP_013753262.1 cobalamin synthesis protein [Thecamonas trahens ATCC 50062]